MENLKNGFAAVLGEFGESSGLAGLGLDTEDKCTVTFDEAVDVHICYVDAADVVLTYAQVGTVSEGGEAEAFRERLLRANFFWEESNGFTLALDGDKVMLTDRRPAWYFVDGEHLAAYLEGCFDLVRIWRSRLPGSDPD